MANELEKARLFFKSATSLSAEGYITFPQAHILPSTVAHTVVSISENTNKKKQFS